MMMNFAAIHGLASAFPTHVLALQVTNQGAVFGVNETLFLVFTGLLLVAVLIQTAILASMAIGAKKAQKELLPLVQDFHTRAIPILTSARAILEDAAPKVKVISSNAVAASNTLRIQAVRIGDVAEHVGQVVDEVADRARRQAERVDGIVTGGINGVAEVTASVQHGVMVPIREMQGLVKGVMVGLEVLMGRKGPGRSYGSHDGDMFV